MKHSSLKAVPGGSVLKMLGGLKELKAEIDWSKVFLFYVNHKCVPNDDASATHFKALSIFLDACPAVAHPMATAAAGVTKGHDTDAHLYRNQIEAVLPLADGLPIFDYMLLGMGKDGHIGSLYPGRKEVLMTDKHQWVLSVDKKSPSSISLSLPVMNAARYCTVLYCTVRYSFSDC
jgi:6-phosphogluconolactonase